jgi:hypothetical protein
MKKDIRIWVTEKRMTIKIRSGCGPLIRDYEKWLNCGWLGGNWIEFGNFGFGGIGRRRGAHVNPLKIGSRDGQNCFWGNVRFCAELRRNWGWEMLGWLGMVGVLVGCYVDLWGGGTIVVFPQCIKGFWELGKACALVYDCDWVEV